MSKKSGFAKFLGGLAVGAGLGVLFAPKKGSETRKDLMDALNGLWNKAKDIDIDEVKHNFQMKIDNIKKELEDLDREKVLKIAKKKGEQLKEKCEDLIALAKAKGTPILEKSAKEIKAKTADVVREVLKKLEAE